MDAQKVDMFMLSNAKHFEAHQLLAIRERLLEIDDSRWSVLSVAQFKDPNTALLLSVIGGTWGIDRFYIGDTGLGILKLFTCGGLGIWTIVDWFSIQSLTRQKNFIAISQLLY